MHRLGASAHGRQPRVAALARGNRRPTRQQGHAPQVQRTAKGWEGKRQHVITVTGTHASAKVLIISDATHSALALMVMRCAANVPIEAADRDKPAFLTAGSILRAAQQQRASGY